MKSRYTVCLLLYCAVFLRPFSLSADTLLNSIGELASACASTNHIGTPFKVEGELVAYRRKSNSDEYLLTLTDGRFSVSLYENEKCHYLPEKPADFQYFDRIAASGVIRQKGSLVYASFDGLSILGHHPERTIQTLSFDDILTADKPIYPVKTQGMVRGTFIDESDPHYIYMTLCNSRDLLYAMIYSPTRHASDLSDLIGSDISICGTCINSSCGQRNVGRILDVISTNQIEILRGSNRSSKLLPDLDDLPSLSPSQVASLGMHQVSGVILAVWQKRQILIRSEGGKIVKAQVQNVPAPAYGQRVHLTGIPETDLYFVNLSHAEWERADLTPHLENRPEDISVENLLFNASGEPQLNIQYHGKAIRISGIIRYLSRPENDEHEIHIESGKRLVAIDASATPEVLRNLSAGCKISVVGTCIVDTENWQPGASPKQARGFFIVLREPSDITITSRPSWWTPARLLSTIVILALALIGIVIWNRMLHVTAERRGRELAQEQIGHIASNLKVLERTRLAVDLHDSMSQTLSGISMEIGTASELIDGNNPELQRHLDFAARAIDGCRVELKNCLWDLRSQALDENDLNQAIRKTLRQSNPDDPVSIRFNVPRSYLSDNTTHAILKIVRELVANATNHGHATSVLVAGAFENGQVKFSVKDNGCGFDPDNCPGVAQAHFGLEGVRERVEQFGGEMSIVSARGKGTKVSISIRATSASENV